MAPPIDTRPVSIDEYAGICVTTVPVGALDNNTYLVTDTATQHTLLVDAANEPDVILENLGQNTVTAIVTTHCHVDHWLALQAVADATAAPTYAGVAEASGIHIPTTTMLRSGDRLTVGRLTVEALEVTGHKWEYSEHVCTSIVLRCDDQQGHTLLFTGDTLFPGGVGNTCGDHDAFDMLYSQVVAKLFDTCTDDTVVYPGHGSATTIGAQRPQLTAWKARRW